MNYIDDLKGAIASKEHNQAELQAQLEPLRDQLRWLKPQPEDRQRAGVGDLEEPQRAVPRLRQPGPR